MKSKPVSFVKAHLAEVIATVRKSSEPLVVTQNGASAVVIQDVEAYQRMREALLLLKLVALGEHEIDQKGTVPHDKVFTTVRARLAARKKRAA